MGAETWLESWPLKCELTSDMGAIGCCESWLLTWELTSDMGANRWTHTHTCQCMRSCTRIHVCMPRSCTSHALAHCVHFIHTLSLATLVCISCSHACTRSIIVCMPAPWSDETIDCTPQHLLEGEWSLHVTIVSVSNRVLKGTYLTFTSIITWLHAYIHIHTYIQI